MRFLFDWQHLSPGTQGQGSAMLAEVVAQFEGYPAAASAWDSDLLPARLKDYSANWLDELCRSGKVVWSRINSSGKSVSSALRSTPIVLLPRAGGALEHPDLPARTLRAVTQGAEGPCRAQRAGRTVFR